MNKKSVTELYDHLVSKLGKETAEKLTNFMESEIDYKFEYNMKTLATKDDLSNLALAIKDDMVRLELATNNNFAKHRLETKQDFANLKDDFANLKDDFANLRQDFSKHTLETKQDFSSHTLETKHELAKLDNKITETKNDIIRWMFAFWVTVILMFISLYFKS